MLMTNADGDGAGDSHTAAPFDGADAHNLISAAQAALQTSRLLECEEASASAKQVGFERVSDRNERSPSCSGSEIQDEKAELAQGDSLDARVSAADESTMADGPLLLKNVGRASSPGGANGTSWPADTAGVSDGGEGAAAAADPALQAQAEPSSREAITADANEGANSGRRRPRSRAAARRTAAGAAVPASLEAVATAAAAGAKSGASPGLRNATPQRRSTATLPECLSVSAASAQVGSDVAPSKVLCRLDLPSDRQPSPSERATSSEREADSDDSAAAPAARRPVTDAELLMRVAVLKRAAGCRPSAVPGLVQQAGAWAPEPESLRAGRRAYSFSHCESALAHGQLGQVRVLGRA